LGKVLLSVFRTQQSEKDKNYSFEETGNRKSEYGKIYGGETSVSACSHFCLKTANTGNPRPVPIAIGYRKERGKFVAGALCLHDPCPWHSNYIVVMSPGLKSRVTTWVEALPLLS